MLGASPCYGSGYMSLHFWLAKRCATEGSSENGYYNLRRPIMMVGITSRHCLETQRRVHDIVPYLFRIRPRSCYEASCSRCALSSRPQCTVPVARLSPLLARPMHIPRGPQSLSLRAADEAGQILATSMRRTIIMNDQTNSRTSALRSSLEARGACLKVTSDLLQSELPPKPFTRP